MGTPAITLNQVSARQKRRQSIDWITEKLIYASAFVAISLILLIFVFVGKEALPVITSAHVHEEVTLETMFLAQQYGTEENPLPYVWQPVSAVPKYSLMPLLLGTLKVTLIAMMFATPLALLAAIYTTEFAPRWLREAIKPVVEMLAGIPSVVLGFFALIVLASWLQDAFDLDFRLNAIAAGLAMGLAVLPIIYTISEDALTAVPRHFRNASFALGS